MVVATGVDIAEIDRIERALGASHGSRFRERVYMVGEQRYCDGRRRGCAQSYAARFAAKEAVMKALGVGWGKHAGWSDIEVVRASGGPPRIELSGALDRSVPEFVTMIFCQESLSTILHTVANVIG